MPTHLQKSRRGPENLRLAFGSGPAGIVRHQWKALQTAARPRLNGRSMPQSCHDYKVMDASTRLGVPSNADANTVRAAFARQMRVVHPDIVGPYRDPGSEVAALIAARDNLLARATPVPGPRTGPVVFVQRRGLAGTLRAWVYHRKQPRRHLC
jgi:hypothetical protein